MNRREKEAFIKKDNRHSGVRALTVALFTIAIVVVVFVFFLVILNATGIVVKNPDGSIKLDQLIQ